MGLPVPELVPVPTGIALPRTGIGNLRVWVPTYVSSDGWVCMRGVGRPSVTHFLRHPTQQPNQSKESPYNIGTQPTKLLSNIRPSYMSLSS